MDSLLANYASSDEEQEEDASLEQKQVNRNQEASDEDSERVVNGESSKPSSLFSSLPPPKSSPSLFSSLPPPKTRSTDPQPGPKQIQEQQRREASDDESERVENSESSKPSSLFSSLPQPKSSSSLFSSLPPPKTHLTDPQPGPNPDLVPRASAKRVVQIRPPLVPPVGKRRDVEDEDEEEDEEEKERRRKKVEASGQTASVKSFLSSIPAPRNSATLGALPSASGTGRRSIIETSNSGGVTGGSEVGDGGNVGGYKESVQYVDGASVSSSGSLDYAVGGGGSSGDYSNWGAGNQSYVSYDSHGGHDTVDYSNWNAENGNYPSYGSESVNYSNYGHYENNWSDGSATTVASEVPVESELRLPAKRGRKDEPPQIVEVNQDELMKNRPREDQVKLTGIAFGPSYQPASAKGMPSKLHKRKHQIGSLYFDMKQKEMELAERRARGFLTKAQTQGKYGW